MIPKTELNKITVNGYKFAYFEDGVYSFQKGDYKTGFYLIECSEADIKSGNIIDMLEMEVTYNKLELRKIKRKYKSKLMEGAK